MGSAILVVFWILGYDGITFSDDVFYILTGEAFWKGETVLNAYHFSSRFGAYLFSGIFTHLFGLDDRIASIPSLLAYLATLFVIIKALPKQNQQFWAAIFFVSHVFLLHFLPKVYPDSLLVMWVVLVPFAATSRAKRPILAAFLLVLSLLIGFATKETTIYLFPFPVLLFLWDLKQGKPLKFHLWLGSFALVFGAIYLGYYWSAFGDPFYRINSVNAGHYISEYSYNDKAWPAMLNRLTISPLITFVERSYWLWLALAVPGVYVGLVKGERIAFEFALALVCLMLGFWFMSTSLELYNPIYLNPRHLIILIPILAVLIGYGCKYWLENDVAGVYWGIGVLQGAVIGLLVGDFKNGLFLLVFGLVMILLGGKFLWLKKTAICCMLLAAVVFSFSYQRQLKNYPHFIHQFESAIDTSQELLVVNNFVHFSREVLLPYNQSHQERLLAVEDTGTFGKRSPGTFGLFIYKYYKHAYPKETPDIEEFLQLTEKMGYEMIGKKEDKWVVFYSFSKKGISN
ncbi:ArnT family glycosyltransferase [Belliella marina]|uniref:ArnT family glycosyltransferase n=1 Tax=Belliella marina TaxID=1644146 RepID=A0ABW4VVY9_9BACT